LKPQKAEATDLKHRKLMAPTIPACGGKVGVFLHSSGLSSASHVVQSIQLQRGEMLKSLI
jgi:hypothetical protein